MRHFRLLLVPVVLMGLLLVTAAPAQDKKPLAEKHDNQALVDSLRDVINTGADLFNLHGDYAGCYRVYQGALLSIKPFLTLDLQGKIEVSIAKAERMARYSDRAFELRTVIDQIRDQGKGPPPAVAKKAEKTEIKKIEVAPPPKIDEKKGEKKMSASLPPGDAAMIQGIVTWNGKAAPPGFLTLIGADERRFSTSITDGAYKFKTPLPAGRYRIAIERVPGAQIPVNLDIPERYRSEGTSGLTIELKRGKMNLDFNLVK